MLQLSFFFFPSFPTFPESLSYLELADYLEDYYTLGLAAFYLAMWLAYSLAPLAEEGSVLYVD